MKSLNFFRRPISMYVAIAFLAMVCLWANQTPAAPTAPAADKSAPASMDKNEGAGTGFIESEETAPHAKSGKKFPWLIVAVVVIAGGAALYFLVLKKKNYTLTVNVGEGVTGTPASGSSSNKKGTVVNYSYSLQSGYDNLAVTLDGAAVAASGTITMNANHTLEAKATKTFVLTVTRGEHVTGSPGSGTYTYARGSNVSYSYAPASGYAHLEVKIDNVAAAASGTIAMNDNHTLTATLYGANLEVDSTPAGARIYLDNVDSGHNTPYTFNFDTAVTNKAVHLRYSCGYKEYREVVSVALGQTKTVNHTMAPGIWEEFLIPASSCWHPYTSANWTSILELYRFIGSTLKWERNYYSYLFSGDYSVSVHMNRKSGRDWGSNTIFLGTGTSMTSANGYSFQYQTTGNYSIYRYTNYNFVNSTGTTIALKNWTSSSAIDTGLNKFNVMKVVKNGTSYSFYIKNTLLTTITDATFIPTYLTLQFYVDGVHTEIQYNYVTLTPGGSAPGSLSCPPESPASASSEHRDHTGAIIRNR
jgi:hypothetical protein